MSYSTLGASNRQVYDCCAYAQSLQQSVDPLQYQLYFGAYENCGKCIDKKAWFKQDTEIIDIESDLSWRTRPLSKCDQYKYNPNCETSAMCTSTFDPNIPKILSPSLCPIVHNNIPVTKSPGYNLPNTNICQGKNEWIRADTVNTYTNYNQNNKEILGTNNEPRNSYMFLNSCSNEPLYNGSSQNIHPYLANQISNYGHNPSTNHPSTPNDVGFHSVSNNASKIPSYPTVSMNNNVNIENNVVDSDSEYN